jgi:hypothetical protein
MSADEYRECGCRGTNENCPKCYGNGYVRVVRAALSRRQERKRCRTLGIKPGEVVRAALSGRQERARPPKPGR